MCFTRHRVYPATTAAISSARDFTSASLVAVLEPRGWVVADDAVLVVSELMTGCIEAAAAHVDVRLELHYDTVHIEVVGEQGQPAAVAAPVAAVRARVLDAVTLKVDLDSADGTVHGVAHLPCDPTFTTRLACAHRPEPVTT